jgi:hypothetical protein
MPEGYLKSGCEMDKGPDKPDQKRLSRLLLALFFALISFGRDVYLTRGFSIGLYKDTLTYILAGKSLLGITPALDNKVSVPYPLLTAFTRVDLNPMNLVWLQICLGALAVGWLVYILSRRSIFLSVLVGVMLSSDLLWGAFNHAILTEGLIMSCLVISLALMIAHYDRKEHLRPWELILSGLFFAWTFSIKPGYVYILPLIILYYLWLTRSWRKAAWITGGLVLLLGLSGLLNLARFGEFRVFGNSSMYLDPITGNDIFSPANGPYSRRITDLAKSCGIDLLSVQNRSDYRGDLTDCAASHGVDDKTLAQWYGSIYKETITSHPLAFAASVVRRSAKIGRAHV